MKKYAFTIAAIIAVSILVGCKGGQNVDWKKKFVKKKDPPPEVLVDQLFNANAADTRRIAIEKLSKTYWINEEKNRDLVAQMTNPAVEKSPVVRSAAVRTLAKLNDPKYFPNIANALKDENATVRFDAADSFELIIYEPAEAELQRLALDDENEDVRTAACQALKNYRSDETYRTLLRCLEDESFTVRESAHESLVTMTGVDNGRDPTKWVADPKQLGKETLPAKKKIIYRKRPWWDWGGMTKETVEVKEGEQPNIMDDLKMPGDQIKMEDLSPVRVEDNAKQPATKDTSK
jgi:hypothetical protein